MRIFPWHSRGIINEDKTPCIVEVPRSVLTIVTMQTPDALQDKIHGSRISEHQVEVDVKALFNNLRGHHNVTLWSMRTVLSEKFEHPPVTLFTLHS